MEGLGLAAVEVGAEAAVAAPAAVAAIPEAVAEDHHATRHATAVLVPVPKYTTVFSHLVLYPSVFTSEISNVN